MATIIPSRAFISSSGLTLQTSKLLHDLCAAAHLQMLEASRTNACANSMSVEDRKQKKKRQQQQKPRAELASAIVETTVQKQQKKTVRFAEPLVTKKRVRFAEPLVIEYEYDPEDIHTVADVQEASEEEEDGCGLQDHEATQRSLAGSEALRIGAALAATLLEKKAEKNLKINSTELADGTMNFSLNLQADRRLSKINSPRVIKEWLKAKLRKQSKKLRALFCCHRA
jgi:hypothetical protein